MGYYSELTCHLEESRSERLFAGAEEVPEGSGEEQSTLAPEAAPPELPAKVQTPASSDDARRQVHEAAEAERKAEWETAQAKKRAAEQAQFDRLAAMSPEDIAVYSVKRVSADTERLPRRNMKDCVSEHIQTLCRDNPAFARQVLHPRKTMVNCFRYIYRKAKAFAEQEMKDLGESHVNGVYGLDVPDGLCYQWAEAYFNDLDAPEDKEKDDEFVPKPYYGGSKAKKTPDKKQAPKPKAKPQSAIDGQISLLGEAG